MLNLELLIPFWKVIIFLKKQIVPFATSGGSGISNVVEKFKKLIIRSLILLMADY